MSPPSPSGSQPRPRRERPRQRPAPDPRHRLEPHDRLRDPQVAARYRSCLLSLLLLSGGVPFLGISYLVIRSIGAVARYAPLSTTERLLAMAAQVVFLWSALAVLWGLILAAGYLRARLQASRRS